MSVVCVLGGLFCAYQLADTLIVWCPIVMSVACSSCLCLFVCLVSLSVFVSLSVSDSAGECGK